MSRLSGHSPYRKACPLVLATLCLSSVCGCAHTAMKPVVPVPEVALSRFMGDWYVIAHIASFVERNAYDAVESYAIRPDGRIQTTFRYRNERFDAPLKTMRPIGTVVPGTGNAVWGMQFIGTTRGSWRAHRKSPKGRLPRPSSG